MPNAAYSPMPPELGPIEIDTRSIHAFWHGYPNPLVRWHLHNEYELHLIIASTGRVFVGDHVGDFAPGHLVMTGPHLPHNWISQTPPNDTVEMRDGVIQFRKDLVHSMATSASEFKKLLPLLDRARYGIEFRPALCGEAEKWFENIINSDGMHRIGLLFEILERLSLERDYRMLTTIPPKPDKNIEQMELLESVMSYIDKHHTSTIRVESIAKLLGMTDSSFSRFFAQKTGSSFTHFLTSVRIAHACELLSSTDRPIIEICFDVGFNNVANFNRRFRECKHLTPSEYRLRTAIGHR